MDNFHLLFSHTYLLACQARTTGTGYPDGYKSYSRSKPLTIEEFDQEKKWWGGAERRGRKTNEYAWKVSSAEIAEKNYNLDAAGKNPHRPEVQNGEHFTDPEQLLH